MVFSNSSIVLRAYCTSGGSRPAALQLYSHRQRLQFLHDFQSRPEDSGHPVAFSSGCKSVCKNTVKIGGLLDRVIDR